MFAPRVILHPTDFSDCSKAACQIAADLADKYQARPLVLHVVETLGPENVTYGEAVSQLEPDRYRSRLHQDLRNWAASMKLPASADLLIREGDPATEIERAAGEHEGCVIVMGTHGRTGLKRLLMGSIAESVIRRAPCPVLVVRSNGQEGKAT